MSGETIGVRRSERQRRGRSTQSTYARIRRRETHSSRSTPAIVVASVLCLLCVWAATEITLALLDAPALVASPATVGTALTNLDSVPSGYLFVAGVVAALIGGSLIALAVSAGRRARHLLSSDSHAAVVDDNVIASAVARRAAQTAGISPDSVRVTVSRRFATVRVIPSSGTPVDAAAVESAAKAQLDEFGIVPPLRPRVRIASEGKVGA